MRSLLFIIPLAVTVLSCKSEKKQHGPNDKKYQLGLHIGNEDTIKYYYTISNNTQTILEVDGRKIENSNTTDVGLLYTIVKDSIGNTALTIVYDSIHVHGNMNNVEKDLDAANADNSIDPIEKMLGKIKGARLFVIMAPSGKILSIKGYDDIKANILQGLTFKDSYTQNTLQQQLSKLIGEGFVKSNLEQTINLLPDSTVYVGDTWKSSTSQAGDISMKMLNQFTVESIDDDFVKISVVSKILSDSSKSSKVMGYDITPNLKGNQIEYLVINKLTGLVINSTINSTIEGNVQAMGREIPITIITKKTLVQKKI
ncbi:DUF6263 family protein [Parasediminibacterium paludis]|uniref:DUF6263 family protein n=1 Tax=Parasediminibacterium paludis TaxID=908966 RepID=A0ABV8PW77_9BACT